ncbi:hypothetical protein F503_03996 [Ophiostoma piceae UAMH 11346]|uniref:Uncharacterized protein n=1 Tax=Ophiostoma piceae (strain UAMH 11346) TaxID=1262450 RepID=S3BQK2_OPHP1|nr:hypothetical protein F503_03996 [Ophiostoma piceae UAMH 11346]
MPSFKHVFLALACLAFQHVGMATASPTKLRVRSDTAYPTAVFTGARTGVPSGVPSGVPTAFTAAPSGSGVPGADHKHGGPGDFGPGAHNQTHKSFAANGGVNSTDPCDDMPGNHTRHTEHHDHRHHNQTGGPDLDLHHNRSDLLASGTPTGPLISLITPPPDATAVTAAKGAKFVQTTYYSCVTIGPDSHCGWHEPILDASTSNSARHGLGKAWLSAVVVVAVAAWM